MTLDERLADFNQKYPAGMTSDEFKEVWDSHMGRSRAAARLAKEMRRTIDNDAAAIAGPASWNGNRRLRTEVYDEVGDAPTYQPSCLTCSSAATHGEYCVYCRESQGKPEKHDAYTRKEVDERYREGARARMAAADRRDAPKATATTRELAKPHPWECDE